MLNQSQIKKNSEKYLEKLKDKKINKVPNDGPNFNNEFIESEVQKMKKAQKTGLIGLIK